MINPRDNYFSNFNWSTSEDKARFNAREVAAKSLPEFRAFRPSKVRFE